MAKKKRATKSKKGEVNQSAEIRRYLSKKPKAGPKEISAALGESGIVVTPGFVSTIKTAVNKKKGGRNKNSARGGQATTNRVSLSTLVQAKKLVDDMGGVEKAKDALNALARLR